MAQLRAQAQPLIALFEEAARKEGLPSPEKLLHEAQARAEAEAAAQGDDAAAIKEARPSGRVRPVKMAVEGGVKTLGSRR